MAEGGTTNQVFEEAKRVLIKNNQGEWTIPASGLYPHQWLWDSCFIAIGMRHFAPDRAAAELQQLLRGQWSNGMLPHMIFSKQRHLLNDYRLWESKRSPYAPRNIQTSGITQPPLLAEATQRVAEKLSFSERKAFLEKMVPAILRHHEWLYRERNPRNDGLIVLIHPWETGLDNSPSWMDELKSIHTPKWIWLTDWLRLDWIITRLRRDTKNVPIDQRVKTSDLLRLHHAQQDLRRHDYDLNKILWNPHRHFLVESLGFNCILIRNNEILLELADEIGLTVDGDLKNHFKQTVASLTTLCNFNTGVCYHRKFDEQMIEEQPTITILFPFYAGILSQRQAAKLAGLMTNPGLYWTQYPIPSVPLSSDYFSEKGYWQGPTWLNTNWLIADGLKRYGYTKEAKLIRDKSIELVAKNGAYEYFSPLNGAGYGAKDFSWTAALAIDFVKQTF